MMTGRERVIRTLTFTHPDRIPRDLWFLPGITMFRKDDLDYILSKYPTDFTRPAFSYGKSHLAQGVPFVKGKYIDEWGCEWEVKEDGLIGEVKTPRFKDLSEVYNFTPPYELLENADLSKVNDDCKNTDKFVLISPGVNLFERMQFLCGTENLFIHLAYKEKEIFILRDILHEFFLRMIKLWCETQVDGIALADDWGSQKSLLISPNTWRTFLKPLYAEYCELIHRYNKFVFFHSDGNIEEIFSDLIEIGVDAINSQLFCMDIRKLAKYKGKITFWGEIDRQRILPFGTTEEVKSAVRYVKDILYTPEGGIIAQCEIGLNVPIENVIAVFEAWEEGIS
jgi:uroporphyrinogen decarboxylase